MWRSRRCRSSCRASSSSLPGVASMRFASTVSLATRRARSSSPLGRFEPGWRRCTRRYSAALRVVGRGEVVVDLDRRPGAARPPRAARCSRPGRPPRSASRRLSAARGSIGSGGRIGGLKRSRAVAAPALAVPLAPAVGPAAAAAAARSARASSPRRTSLTIWTLIPSRSAVNLISSSRSTLAGSGAMIRIASASSSSVLGPSTARARARPRSARSASPSRSSPRISSAPASWTTSAGSCLDGRRTILNSTARVAPLLGLISAAQRLQPALGRRLARAVRVLAEQRLRRQAGDRVDLLLGQRRAHLRDGLRHAGLVQRDHVRVALDDHHAPGLAPPRRGPCPARRRPGSCGRARRRTCSGTWAAGRASSPARRSRARGP